MAINLWGEASLEASPLYDFESLKEGSIPTVTPIDKILDEGNCVRASNRGKEASKRSIALASGSDIRQSCEATDRNPIQGRFGEASGPTTTKPFSKLRIGKLGACAAKVNHPILGRLDPQSGSRLDAERRNAFSKVNACLQFAAEVVVLTRRTPATTGRTEL
jgi:hypothetical protein